MARDLTRIEVIANDMILLDGRESRPARDDGDSAARRAAAPTDIGDEDIPF